MLIAGLLIAAIFVVLVVRFWATRDDTSIDLGSPEARQSAAAQWLSDGESDEAERMLRQAVRVLEGWDKALALADLASFMAACSREVEAAEALAQALELAEQQADAPAEQVLELRVQMAQAYSRDGRIDKAREVLHGAIAAADSDLCLGLAEEAFAEFAVRHGELADALPNYERACARLALADHDRAPIAAVRYAHALLIDGQDNLWRAFDALSEELQHAVPVALAHLAFSFERDESMALIAALMDRVGTCGHWQEERESLASIAAELEGTLA